MNPADLADADPMMIGAMVAVLKDEQIEADRARLKAKAHRAS